MRAWFRVAASRVTALFTSRSLDEDFDAEVRTHIEMLTDEHVRRGMARDEARRAAILRFGGAAISRCPMSRRSNGSDANRSGPTPRADALTP